MWNGYTFADNLRQNLDTNIRCNILMKIIRGVYANAHDRRLLSHVMEDYYRV